MRWRVVKYDGTIIDAEQEIIVNNIKKPASIDDIEREEIAQLITFDDNEVAHALTFEKDSGKKAVWRRACGANSKGQFFQYYCLQGYTYKDKKGNMALNIDRIYPDGTTEGADEGIDLHPKEIIE